jgi:S-(hydroxymethyl)glutathione dehydrogenase/alcohol dehydrogenase
MVRGDRPSGHGSPPAGTVRGMRAALFVEQHQDLSLEDVTPIDPGPRDVIVRVHASGVCHSDLAVIERMPGGKPMVLGHEGCGEVEWVGSEVTRVRPGQRVIIALTPVCNQCWFCLRGETHLCELWPTVLATMRVRRSDGSEANAMSGVGSFADVMTVHEASCIPIETDLPADQLALIGCGFTTGFGAAVNTAAVHPGATVAVIGCGGVGTSVIQGARVAGASRIIAIDPLASKRDSAIRFGATDAVDPAAGDPVEQVKALTGGRGADFAFEVVGAEALEAQALEMTRRGGTTVLVGVAGGTARLALPSMRMVMEDRTVKGSYYGSARVTRDFPRFIELIETGRVDLGGMVTKHFALDEVNAAIAAMRNGEVVRGVVSTF